MKSGDTLNGAYELSEQLGQGPWAQTWAVLALEGCPLAQAGTSLVAKILSLGTMPDWKGYDYFEREAAALKSLRHRAVPRYIDSFRYQDGQASYLVMVMERIPGTSLAKEAESGRRWTEAEIETMLAELLEILDYLHQLRPPLIHRDVNPKNIILRPDGSLALVDFSGVQDAVRLAYRDTTTMVGSAGYTPIEQISGRASVRSDLYAAAASAAFLLTRTHPSDLPMQGLKLDPGAVVELSPRLTMVLDNYLEPDESKRTLPPADAIAILRGQKPVATFAQPLVETRRVAQHPAANDMLAQAEQLPSDSRVTLSTRTDLFRLLIPRPGIANPAAWSPAIFLVVWMGFIAFWTVGASRMGAPVFFPMFSLPFWAVGLFILKTFIMPRLSGFELTLSPEGGAVLSQRLLRTKTHTWPLADLGSCRVEVSAVGRRGQRETELLLEVGTKKVRFGQALSDREKRAIAANINAWLASAKG
ncbi:MAG TPA: protein kinase [Spirochaetales bacterium]|nr:protein kinase [Spirochaetales bacterium]